MVENTFFEDFTIADCFGPEAIIDTYEMAFKGWKDSYEMMTALTIALNHKLWAHYAGNNYAYAKIYDELWQMSDQYCIENFEGEELQYYFRETD